MPTKVKGMTSLEIAIIVAIVLAIAIAAAWYLYTTFAATVGSNPKLHVVSAYAYWDGVIEVRVMNIGSSKVVLMGAEVFGTRYPLRGGNWVPVNPMDEAIVYIDTGRWIRLGAIIEGKLITEEGYVIPFTARRVD